MLNTIFLTHLVRIHPRKAMILFGHRCRSAAVYRCILFAAYTAKTN